MRSLLKYLVGLVCLACVLLLLSTLTFVGDSGTGPLRPFVEMLDNMLGQSEGRPSLHHYLVRHDESKKIQGIVEQIDLEPVKTPDSGMVVDTTTSTAPKSEFSTNFKKGLAHFEKGEYEQAEASFGEAAKHVNPELAPSNGAYLDLLAATASNYLFWGYHLPLNNTREELLTKGIASIYRAFPVSPNRLSLLRAYSFANYLQHQFPLALNLINQVLRQRESSTWRDYYYKALYLEMMDIKEEFELTIGTGLKLAPNNRFLLGLLVEYHKNTLNRDLLLPTIDRLLQLKLPEPDLLYYQGMGSWFKRERGSALSALKATLGIDPHYVRAKLLTAEIQLAGKGTRAAATKTLEEVFSKEGPYIYLRDYIQGNYLYAQLFFEGQKYEQAKLYVDNILQKAPNNLRALELTGRLYYRQKKFKAAAEVFERCLKYFPRNPNLFYNLALVRLKLGDRAGAVTALEQTLELNGNFLAAQRKLRELKKAMKLEKLREKPKKGSKKSRKKLKSEDGD